MRTFQLDRPGDLAEAVRILAEDEGARVIAGGTDLVTLMRDGIQQPSRVLDLRDLGLTEIEWQPDGGVRIGALCPNAVDDRRLAAEYPLVVAALRAGASPQIRNMATFGGNILQQTRCAYYRLPEFACNRRDPGTGCAALRGDSAKQAIFGVSDTCNAVHPSDLAVALSALEAEVLVHGPAGARRIPIREFHPLPGDTPHRVSALRDGELVTGIELPAAGRGRVSNYVKFRDRASFAFALASAAVVIERAGTVVLGARIALGGVAPKPWRAEHAERALVGNRLDEDSIAAASAAAVRGATPRKDNEYKVELVRRVVRRALSELE
ncbi:xanthine dehydrogenase YagS FAD-binding subunit [Tamaricihabitans halophyticus]|uniref:Xanthine dehydrogenase YagS FAD-binding subunit n=1 Tax=Tamaricihabitans halophyticus TaxID=1262583 RepID=A0A4R2QQA7_9PSEU|nr:xanthine dehydrogenase family protein subunit M [Tamaricihabitans halophyticus]TCP51923.1 xanthine dehydrogenase YagS FAD-binding subunit [Tamaricihabitans halophyticus]